METATTTPDDSTLWSKTIGGESWHLVDTTVLATGGIATAVCGRSLVESWIRNERPGSEKTCESCLRKAVR